MKNKRTYRRKIFLILMILWMAAIFAFSSRSGDESAQDSYHAGILIGEVIIPGFEEWTSEKQLQFAETIDHPVRKTAHAAEYAILGLLAAGACISSKNSTLNIRDILYPWFIASGYAAADEFHQLFVTGRSGQVSDVLLDSAGALAGLLVLTAIRTFRHRIKNPHL